MDSFSTNIKVEVILQGKKRNITNQHPAVVTQMTSEPKWNPAFVYAETPFKIQNCTIHATV